MKRRDFLNRAFQFSAAGLLVPPFLRGGTVFGHEGLQAAARAGEGAPFGGKILVLLNLEGGNDGLNTVIPRNDPRYYDLRPNIGIPESEILPLAAATGLHPSMSALLPTWAAGRLAIVQGVGYPDMDLSHFRGSDIWFSASGAEAEFTTGWLARFVEASFPDFPTVLPGSPYGLQQGFAHRLPLQGARGETGVIVDSPESFYSLVFGAYAGEFDDELPDTRGGEELAFVRTLDRETFAYASAIRDAADAGQSTVEYPETNLGYQLEAVARLISGGLATPIYLVSQGGFDTHTDQPDWHATILSRVAEGLALFLEDMEAQGMLDRVLVMTTSEFARRAEENGGVGTDHGTSAPHLLLGGAVEGGLLGQNPDLWNLDPNGNLLMQYDYRSLYATVLQRHFGAEPGLVSEVLHGDWPLLAFLSSTPAEPNPGLAVGAFLTVDALRGVSPNPLVATRDRGEVSFQLARDGDVSISLFDAAGRRALAPITQHFTAGAHQITLPTERLPAGHYLLRLRTATIEQRSKVVVLR